MKSHGKRVFFLILTICSAFHGCQVVYPADVVTHFSPLGGCSAKICEQIDAGRESICIAAYQLTSKNICDALARAKTRKLDVSIILDSSMEQRPDIDLLNLMRTGVLVGVDRGEKLFHNKYLIIDRSITVTGSYNFSDNAERRNAENIVIIKDQAIAASFAADFNRHLRHSTNFRDLSSIRTEANSRLANPINRNNSPRKKE